MFFHTQTLRPSTFSMQHGQKDLQFDEAFQLHVAQMAERVLQVDASLLLSEACSKLPAEQIHFTWSPRACTRLQTMLRAVQAHL